MFVLEKSVPKREGPDLNLRSSEGGLIRLLATLFTMENPIALFVFEFRTCGFEQETAQKPFRLPECRRNSLLQGSAKSNYENERGLYVEIKARELTARPGGYKYECVMSLRKTRMLPQ